MNEPQSQPPAKNATQASAKPPWTESGAETQPARRVRKKGEVYSPKAVNALLTAVSRELGLEEKVKEMAVLALWPQLIPETYRHKSKAVAVVVHNRQVTLQVVASDAPTASELTLCTPGILEAFNRFSPQTGCTLQAMQIRVGRILP